MYNASSSGLPQLKRIVLALTGVMVCLASGTAIRIVTANTSSRITTSPLSNISSPSFVQAGGNVMTAPTQGRTLTFAERVSYQRAIEGVYWRHRTWPTERPDSKPSLDAVMTQAQVKKKVADYLRKSQALEDYWQRPITAEQLQDEMDRMAKHTRQPDVLLELFEALGNDPLVIAECLARPALADRLLTSWYAYDQRIHGELKQRAEAELVAHPSVGGMKQLSGNYSDIEFVKTGTSVALNNSPARHAVELDGLEWEQTVEKLGAMFNAGSISTGVSATKRTSVTRIKTGVLSPLQENGTCYYATTLIEKTNDHLKLATVAWLKEPLESWIATAESLSSTAIPVPSPSFKLPKVSEGAGCVDDSWTATLGPPDRRNSHTAVWTGTEMIIWGGFQSFGFIFLSSGGKYNPGTDTWISTNDVGAPSARSSHTAVWTGSDMVVWGGVNGTRYLKTGSRYNPGNDTWAATTATNAPNGRTAHTAVWTGSEMIVWGGYDGFNDLNTGGRYNPSTNSWTPTTITNAPSVRATHTAVWTGNQMIVWGGYDGNSYLNTGGRYNPSSNSWIATSTANVADGRADHTAIWTGREMIIWGGNAGSFSALNTGGRYTPGTNSWAATSVTNAPDPRNSHTAVWTGGEMIVWGGSDSGINFNTGGKYNPATNSWTATGAINAPDPRHAHTAVWAGSEMIVWGGYGPYGDLNTGRRYAPDTDSWAGMSTSDGREWHTAIWTGSEMIIWGGYNGYELNAGGRYSPSIDSWSSTSTHNAPEARDSHTAVWSGIEMIVWGGGLNTGGRYDPGTDSWRATSTTNAPAARYSNTAVWTGTEMIIWGGLSNTGGKYNPSTDRWVATSTANAPTGRSGHTAVWTGSEMIVWGGEGNSGIFNNGGRYNPTANSWTTTSTINAPTGRYGHTSIWSGTEMIVWGGSDGLNNLRTGARYTPGSNSWVSTSTINAPTGRVAHTAIWTGSLMIVWGGGDGADDFNTGGRYNPTTDIWATTSTNDAPLARSGYSAVWSNSEMIIWGGFDGLNFLSTGGKYCVESSGSQLSNISTRSFVQTGDNVMIGGFIVQGAQTKRLIIRAIGPELTHFGVPNALANTMLELHDRTGALIASNDNWRTTIVGGIITRNQVPDIINSGYAPSDGRESAIVADLAPGNYTAIVRGVNDTTGVALVEAYDLSNDASSILGNISTRSFVQTGDNVMIGGFIVQGTGAKRLIIRAIGPELGQFGVPDPLANPKLELHNAAGTLIGSNDDWQHTIIGGVITRGQVADIQNSGHAPTDPSESAIIAELPPGNYTAIVRGINSTMGVALVEVYELH